MNDYRRPNIWNTLPPAVKNLLIINVLLWLATIVLRRFDLTDILGMHYWASDKFNVFQMISYMFMHGGFTHMFFNMFAVFMFGALLEKVWGWKKFLLYYMVTGIGAGIIQQVVWTIDYQPVLNAFNTAISQGSVEALIPHQQEISQYFQNINMNTLSVADMNIMRAEYVTYIIDRVVTVGASGAVFGLLLAYGMMFPNSEIYIMFIPIPIKAKFFVIIYGGIELFLGVSGRMDGIAHFAHLGGMLFGIILILYWKRKGRLFL